MNYKETLDYIFTAFPMYQRIGGLAYKADLENSWKLDSYFGRQHRLFKTIHVGGTNGKGSVSHMLAAILQTAGYRVGLYTSPHLLDFRERIKVNGKEITEDFVMNFVNAHKVKFDEFQPSFFEMTVFMAFAYFAEQKVDYAIIEVGLGGRLDTTNVIIPEVSVITNIGMDHTQYLGSTLQLIAAEKAGIIKKDVPVIIGETQESVLGVFIEKAQQLHCPIYFADAGFTFHYSMLNTDSTVSWYFSSLVFNEFEKFTLDLGGFYQKKNVATVIAVIRLMREKGLEINTESIGSGLKNVRSLTGLAGRWQIIGHNPSLICDIAHNSDGIRVISEQLKTMSYVKLHMILGFVNDKNVKEIVQLLPADASFYLCEPDIPRAMKLAELEPVFANQGYPCKLTKKVSDAYLEAARIATKNDVIFIGGSAFVVADFLRWKKNSNSF